MRREEPLSFWTESVTISIGYNEIETPQLMPLATVESIFAKLLVQYGAA